MNTDLLTIAQAADLLGLDRSNVLRRARRGDFGEVVEVGDTGTRPSMLLIPRGAVEAFRDEPAAS